ncbi:MAG: hypothetical protein K5945_07840 [Bacteroidaceae bacterium]|nr:hypothetical protein [Bacteroidaceae bacterium]
MWLLIILVFVVVGAIWGASQSDCDAGSGAMMGGCLAVGCLTRLFMAGIVILGTLWLFGAIFG